VKLRFNSMATARFPTIDCLSFHSRHWDTSSIREIPYFPCSRRFLVNRSSVFGLLRLFTYRRVPRTSRVNHVRVRLSKAITF